MERYTKAAIIALSFFFLFASAVLVSEIPLIPHDQLALYFTLKILCILAVVPLVFWFKHNVRSQTANVLLGCILFLYIYVGTWFRGGIYYLAYFQLIVGYSFLLPVGKRQFRWVVGIGTALYLALMVYRWPQISESLQHPVFSDYAFGIVAIFFIAVLSNFYFSSDRTFREEALRVYGALGIQAHRIIHDVKGLLSGPKLYVESLRNRMETQGDKDAAEMLQFLSNDLDGLKNILVELNRLSIPNHAEVEKFSLEEAISSLNRLLKKHLHGIQVGEIPRVYLETEKAPVITMLMNIFMNSVQAFDGKQTEPKIWIEVSKEGTILFRDNAGGFPDQVLESLAKNNYISTRKGGTGLGLLFLQDG